MTASGDPLRSASPVPREPAAPREPPVPTDAVGPNDAVAPNDAIRGQPAREDPVEEHPVAEWPVTADRTGPQPEAMTHIVTKMVDLTEIPLTVLLTMGNNVLAHTIRGLLEETDGAQDTIAGFNAII